MMRQFSFIIFVILCAEVFSQGKIDGFYKGKGFGTTGLSLGFEDTKNYYIGTNRSDLGRSIYYANFFGLYGITDDLDINISVPYIISDDHRGLQDVSILMKFRVFVVKFNSGNLELSVAGGVSTPVSDYELGGLNDIGQQATVIESRGVIHYKSKSGWFATLQSGFSFKLDVVPNSLPITIKLGKAMPKLYYDLYYDYQHSFGGIDYLGTPRPQNFKMFGADFHKVGGSVFTPFSEKFGGYISLSYVISGRNVFSGPAYGLGLVYNFRRN